MPGLAGQIGRAGQGPGDKDMGMMGASRSIEGWELAGQQEGTRS